MQRSILISTTSLMLFFALVSQSQSLDFLNISAPANYGASAAILIDGKICDKSYFVEDKPKLMKGMKGTLTIASATSSKACGIPINNIKFQVAIKNDRTNTIWIYTENAVSEVQLQEVLKKCESGDRIILMPDDQKYSLPHNEMSIATGC